MCQRVPVECDNCSTPPPPPDGHPGDPVCWDVLGGESLTRHKSQNTRRAAVGIRSVPKGAFVSFRHILLSLVVPRIAVLHPGLAGRKPRYLVEQGCTRCITVSHGSAGHRQTEEAGRTAPASCGSGCRRPRDRACRRLGRGICRRRCGLAIGLWLPASALLLLPQAAPIMLVLQCSAQFCYFSRFVDLCGHFVADSAPGARGRG